MWAITLPVAKLPSLHVGDLIQKAREHRHWTQTQLGQKATAFPLGASIKPINKSTVSRVESEPWGSDLATVWRLLATLGMNFCDVEKIVGSPFGRPDVDVSASRGSPAEGTRPVRRKRAG